MRIFITAAFTWSDNKNHIEKICSLVAQSGAQDFSFIRDRENYQKIYDDCHLLMKDATQEIEKSDALLLDVSDNPTTWRAIEAGIAYALGKKVIIIHLSTMQVRDSVKWIADIIIPYTTIEDIIEPLKKRHNTQ